MTSDEVKAAIERLRSMKIANRDFIVDVCRAFLGDEVNGDELHYTLIDLLEQADHDTHVELPKDADGEYIHIGDEVEFEYMADKKTFTVKHMTYCENYGWYLGNACIEYPTSEYELYDPIYCRHYHRPTVEDVLTEFVDVAIGDIADKARNENMTYNDWAKSNEIIADYAAKLREVMADDDAR